MNRRLPAILVAIAFYSLDAPAQEAKPRIPPAANQAPTSFETARAEMNRAEAKVKEARERGATPAQLAELQVALAKSRVAYAAAELAAAERINAEARRRFGVEAALSAVAGPHSIDFRAAALTMERNEAEVAAKQVAQRIAGIELQMALVRVEQLRDRK